MLALMKTALGDGHMELRDMPEPSVVSGRVKIEVEYVGICGSDIKILHGKMATDPPVITGHEFSGTIVEVGSGVTAFHVGDRVVSETAGEVCGVCEYCMSGNYLMCPERRSIGYKEHGAFTKYVVVRQEILHKIPDEVSFEEAAMTEPTAVAFHAVYDYARLLPTSNVLVSGPGPLGILVAQMARNATPNVAVCGLSSDSYRLDMVAEMGIKTAYTDKEDMETFTQEFTKGKRFDFVFDCTGAAPAISMGMQCLKNSGTLVQVGIPQQTLQVDYGLIPMKELTIRGVYGSQYPNWECVLRMMKEKQIDLKPMISGIYDLPHWEEAFAASVNTKNVKILIKP